MDVRIRFGKTGSLRYIGHLDILRTFQKIMRRAEIPMSFSQGYSPHPLMSFASPLGVGLTSEGEYVDVRVEDMTSSEDFVKRLRAAAPAELPVYSCRLLPEKCKNAMSLVGIADYRVSFKQPVEYPDFRENMDRFLAQPEIVIVKKTKRQEMETDIRPLIIEMKNEPEGIFMKLSAGSAANLKPELVLETFFEYAGYPFRRENLHIHRINMYTADGVSLEDMGTEVR